MVLLNLPHKKNKSILFIKNRRQSSMNLRIAFFMLSVARITDSQRKFSYFWRMNLKNVIVSHPIWVIVIITLLTRLPFLFNGYGVEEDSYGLVLTAQNIAQTGTYEMSRAPGHPVQELVLSLMPNAPDFVMNGLSMLFGLVASVLFYCILQFLGYAKPLLPTLVMTMIPAFYIASTYTIDYVWALAFILLSFWFLLTRKNLLCGLALAMAVGCRVTSVLGAIPVVIYLLMNETTKEALKHILTIGLSALALVMLLFLPAYLTYGIDFFYTYPLPYPPIPKVLYKGSLGVWGVWGCVALMGAVLLFCFSRKKDRREVALELPKGIILISWMMILMHCILFAKLPEKSAFFIPALPFVVLLIHHYLSHHKLYPVLCALFIISPFLSSVQLADKDRGSTSSILSISKVVSGQDISFDLLYGPIISDYTKRHKKEEFVSKFIDKCQKVNEKSVILCGFWTNHIWLKMKQKDMVNPNVIITPGAPAEDLWRYAEQEYKIYYLREQEKYNVIKYNCPPYEWGVLFME